MLVASAVSISMARFDDVSAVQKIKKQLAEGVSQRRVGLISTGAPARQHSRILTMEGKEVSTSAPIGNPSRHHCFQVKQWHSTCHTLQAPVPRCWAATQFRLEEITKELHAFALQPF